MGTWSEFTTDMAYFAPRMGAVLFFLGILIIAGLLAYKLYTTARVILVYLAWRRFQKRSHERREVMRQSVGELERVVAERRARLDGPEAQ